MLYTNDQEDDYVVIGMTRSGRILNRISAIIYDTVSSGYNFSLGNIKKANEISSNYVDKLSYWWDRWVRCH